MTSSCVTLNVFVKALDHLNKNFRLDQHDSDRIRYLLFTACQVKGLQSRITQHKDHALGFNFLPSYPGTGACITYIASDWLKERIEVPLKLVC